MSLYVEIGWYALFLFLMVFFFLFNIILNYFLVFISMGLSVFIENTLNENLCSFWLYLAASWFDLFFCFFINKLKE